MTTKKPIPVLIDADPGADDFFALLRSMIMHKKGLIDIVAITTSGGNVPAQATFDNAVRAAMMMGINTIKIGKGKDKEGAQNADHIHGKDGIGGLSSLLPLVKKVKTYDSETLLVDTIETYGKELEILTLGPLSNLARIEKKQPGILAKANRVISMGGAFFVPGNVSPVAEFNIWYDPESAKAVFDSDAHTVVAPLDITTHTIFSLKDLEPVLSHINHKAHRTFLTKLTEFTIGTNMMFRETHYKRGFFVHDANTIGFLLYPHLYKGTYYRVQVETEGEYTSGQTIVDVRNHPKNDHINAYVITDVDQMGFLEAMTEDFKDFDFGE